MIRNINDRWGMTIEIESVEEMGRLLLECGFTLPEDGLKEGRDFETVAETSKDDLIKELQDQYREKFPASAKVMNGYTGSVDTWSNWISDIGNWFEDESDWGRVRDQMNQMVRVRRNRRGEYVAV